MKRTEAEQLILQGGWLAAQSAPFQTLILRKARLIAFQVGSFVYHLGDEVGGIYGIVEGGVGIHVPQPNAETTLAHIARRGVWFGHGPLITRRNRVLEFSIIEPTLLFHVPLAALDEIGAADPANPRALYAVSEFGMDIAIATIATLQIRNVERRIAATLLRIAPPGEVPVDLFVTQSQLGEMANVARDVVNRVLADFEKKGLVRVAYKKVSLLDTARLRALATGTA